MTVNMDLPTPNRQLCLIDCNQAQQNPASYQTLGYTINGKYYAELTD